MKKINVDIVKDKFRWKNIWVYVVAFMIPMALFLGGAAVLRIYPFGNNSFLDGDASLQYLTYFSEFYHKVKSGESFLYSWTSGLGYNFWAVNSYYLISPLNCMVLLFPEDKMEAVVSIILYIKVAFISVTSVYYFIHSKINRSRKYKKIIALICGLGIGLSSYVMVYYNNIMWLDVLILFPLILLQLEKLIYSGKWIGYYVLLVFAMFTNYYISFIMCIFMMFWFIDRQRKGIKEFFKRGLLFAVTSIMAALTSGIVLVPSYISATNRYMGTEKKAFTDSIIKSYGNISDAISKMFTLSYGENQSLSINGDFNLYCGALILLGFFIYMFLPKPLNKYKLKRVLLAVFMLVSMCVGRLEYLWHGLSMPNMLYHRFAIFYIFVLMTILCEMLTYIKYVNLKKCIISFVCVVVGTVIVFFTISKFDNPLVYLSTWLLLALYFMMIVLYKRKSIKQFSLYMCFIIIMMIEVLTTAGLNLLQRGVVDNYNGYDLNTYNNLVDKLDLDEDERVAVYTDLSNIGMYLEVPTGSINSSINNSKVLKLYRRLGLLGRDHGAVYTAEEITPVIGDIFNYKYIIANDAEIINKENVVYKQNDIKVMERQATTGLGYMLNEGVLAWKDTSNNPFVVQNEFAKAIGVKQDIFEDDKVSFELSSGDSIISSGEDNQYKITNIAKGGMVSVKLDVKEAQHTYVYVKNASALYTSIIVDGEIVFRREGRETGSIIDLGYLKKGQDVELQSINNMDIATNYNMSVYVASYDDEAYKEFNKLISSNVMTVDTREDTYVKGHIKADKKGVLMTTIADDGGFKVYVDGKEAKYDLVGDCLISIPLDKGEHTIEFKYIPVGFVLGSIMTAIGVVITMGFIFIQKRYFIKKEK